MEPQADCRSSSAENCKGGVSTMVAITTAQTEPETIIGLLDQPPAVHVDPCGRHLIYDGHVTRRSPAVGTWWVAEGTEIHPGVYREVARGHLQVGRITGVYEGIDPIKRKGLAGKPRSKCYAAMYRADAPIDEGSSIPVCWRPSRQPARTSE